jgi:nitrogen fixation NifU-like protein
MPDLRELYQELILDHSKNPRNYRRLEAANRAAEGFNPLCGDHFHLYLRMEDDRIAEIGFEGSGCALSKASASMMTSAMKGKTAAEAEALFERFHAMVTGKAASASFASWAVKNNSGEGERSYSDKGNGAGNGLGKLSVFAGVSQFPVRVKCVSLAWHTLIAALKGQQEAVSTE